MLVQEKNLLHIKLAWLSSAIILEMPLRITGRTTFFVGFRANVMEARQVHYWFSN